VIALIARRSENPLDNKEWNRIWKKHVDPYLKSVPEQGNLILLALGTRNVHAALEVGAGSCRNSVFLAQNNVDTVALDYCRFSLNKANMNLNNKQNINFIVADAFHLPFKDDAFDLVFHDSVFIFYDDENINNLLDEQKRVTRKFVAVTVHCAENKIHSYMIRRKRSESRLYDFRFFKKNEIISLLETHGIILRLLPQGIDLRDEILPRKMPLIMETIIKSLPIWRLNFFWMRYFIVIRKRN
jgi:SAM-dependent methyltransferase